MASDGQVDSAGEPSAEALPDDYADTDPSALTEFRPALDPYGQWVEDPTYGTVWQPSPTVVGADFAPYETAGHWAYGDDYTWVSDYSWGWAPFHYGRWVYATNGWGWIPGRRYAGAWATWRTGYGAYDGYVGWAPLPPTYFWRGRSAYGLGVIPPAPYAFCRSSELFSPTMAGHMITGPQVSAIGQSTRPVAGTPLVTGGHGVMGYAAGGGRTVANPQVAGPSPQSLHIAGESVTRPPLNNPGLARAMQLAHPSTAVALGARPPAGYARPYGATGRGGVASAGGRGTVLGTSAYGAYGGGGRAESRTLSGSSAAVGRTGVVVGRSAGVYGGGPVYGGAAHYGGGLGGGGFGGGSFHGGVVHGGGAGVVPTTQSHPVYGGGFHPSSGGGGGGGHFGGHGGGGGGHSGGHR
jgi:hypothetical protein